MTYLKRLFLQNRAFSKKKKKVGQRSTQVGQRSPNRCFLAKIIWYYKFQEKQLGRSKVTTHPATTTTTTTTYYYLYYCCCYSYSYYCCFCWSCCSYKWFFWSACLKDLVFKHMLHLLMWCLLIYHVPILVLPVVPLDLPCNSTSMAPDPPLILSDFTEWSIFHAWYTQSLQSTNSRLFAGWKSRNRLPT